MVKDQFRCHCSVEIVQRLTTQNTYEQVSHCIRRDSQTTQRILPKRRHQNTTSSGSNHSRVVGEEEGGEMRGTAPFLIFPCFILLTVAIGVSNRCGYETGIDKMKEEAIRAGVAEWVADASGKQQFKWKEAK